MPPSTIIRKFRWVDIEHWTFLFNSINGISSTEKAWDVELAQQFLSQLTYDPEKNCYLVDMNGKPVGYVLVSPELPIGRAVASGGVSNQYQNMGIGRILLAAALKRAKELGVSILHIQIQSEISAGRHLLESSGFHCVRSFYDMMWQGKHIHVPDPPCGIAVRTFVISQDEEKLAQLQNAAFTSNWGFCPNTAEQIASKLNLKTYNPEGIILVTDGDNLAGYNWTMRIDGQQGGIGKIAMTGVHPDYRRRGIGRIALLSGMRYLIAQGVNNIYLEVDGQNSAAMELYEATGFLRINQTVWYEKKL